MEKGHSEKQRESERGREQTQSGTPHPQEVDGAPQGFILVRAGSGWRGRSGKAIANLN